MFSINELKYGGKYHKCFWQDNIYASTSNGLANCTCMTYGDCLKDGIVPISKGVNANLWHKYLINGWSYTKFDINKVKVGDIIEWVSKCHVARVDAIKDGVIYLNCSWYTGEHGVSVYNGNFDTRNSIKSLEQLSNFMITNYPTRFYHYYTLEQESKCVGGNPEYILVMPTYIKPDGKNETYNQINVLTNEQNVRQTPNGNIIGKAQSGYYNVEDITNDTYTWYKVKDGYIAGVQGRVEYIKAKDSELNRIKKENEKYLKLLKQINSLSEV